MRPTAPPTRARPGPASAPRSTGSGSGRGRGKRYRNYSLGMRQRLGIAAALLQPRELLILDEPTNGLDPQGTREVRHLIQQLGREGVTVFVSSHLLSEVEQVCTHVGRDERRPDGLAGLAARAGRPAAGAGPGRDLGARPPSAAVLTAPGWPRSSSTATR